MDCFVGCYGGIKMHTIHWLQVERNTEDITPVATYTGIENPSYIAVRKGSDRLYAISEAGNGEVVCLHLDREKLQITERNRKQTYGSPCYVAIHETERLLFVANYAGGSIVTYQLEADGAIGEVIDHLACDDTEKKQVSRIHTIRRVRDTRFYIATDIGQHQLHVLQLTNQQRLHFLYRLDVPDGCGPREIACHTEKNVVYIVNEYHCTVLVYEYDHDMTNMTLVQVLPTTPVSYKGENYGAAILFHEAQQKVYISNRGYHSILSFDVGEDGRLYRDEWIKLKGAWPRHFTVFPDGNGLMVANEVSGDLTMIDITEKNVKVKHRQYLLNQPVCVVMSECSNS